MYVERHTHTHRERLQKVINFIRQRTVLVVFILVIVTSSLQTNSTQSTSIWCRDRVLSHWCDRRGIFFRNNFLPGIGMLWGCIYGSTFGQFCGFRRGHGHWGVGIGIILRDALRESTLVVGHPRGVRYYEFQVEWKHADACLGVEQFHFEKFPALVFPWQKQCARDARQGGHE